jgi:NAD(P) transhydrogenase subunit alpha
MKPGSVIVDIAAGKGPIGPHGEPGGNCPLTEAGKTVQKYGVFIIGETNIPALVAADSSSLYARNVLDFLKLIAPPAAKGEPPASLKVDLEDDIVDACLMTQGGAVKRK